MKRIDDKIKEIEKKDKKYRILYILFIISIVSFMAYVFNSEKKIKTQSKTIVSQTDTINYTKEQLKYKNDSLIKVVEKLKNSLTPERYWVDVKNIGTAKAYINYVSADDRRIKINYRPEAIVKIEYPSTKGTIGWLYIGNKSGDKLVKGICTIGWRNDDQDVNPKDIPIKGDILELNGSSRYIYSSFRNAKKSNKKKGSWPVDDKAYVLDIKTDGPAVYIKIKF